MGLVGPLGAGKTHLVKGLAAGIGWTEAEEVTSPTFTLVHEYHGALVLFHVDVYRLRSPAELRSIGFEELSRPWTALVVEWADRIKTDMPSDTLWIELSILGPTARTITLRAEGEKATRLVQALSVGGIDTSKGAT